MNSFFELSLKQKASIFFIIAVTISMWAFDAIDDLSHGSNWTHLAVEAILLALVSLWVVSIAVRYFLSKKQNLEMRVNLDAVRRDLENYRSETAHLARGLSLKIDHQLEKWSMTEAEKEVALLLLKGFSNKEISGIRGTSEKTTVQQVSSIYHKSGLTSRAEFAAFFLEDLLIPVESNLE